MAEASPRFSPVSPTRVERIERREADGHGRTVMCLVDSPASYLNASLLVAALERARVASRAVVMGMGSARHLGAVENYAEIVDLPALELHLGVGVGEGSAAQRTADAVLRCEAMLDEFLPDLIIPMGLSDEIVSCALLASRNAVPLLRVGAGVRPSDAFEPSRLNASLLDRMASLLYAPAAPAALALGQDGVSPERVHILGSLTQDSLTAASNASPLAPALMSHHGLTSGFVLVSVRVGQGRLSPQSLSKLVLMLSRVRGDRPMLWLVCGETQSALRAQGLGTVLSRSGISLASMPVFSARLSILQRAACLITDVADDLVEVCMALGTSLLLLDEDDTSPPSSDPRVNWLTLSASELGLEFNLTSAAAATPSPAVAAPSAADAMATHLEAWLSRREAGELQPAAVGPLARTRQKEAAP